jgi:hypothetical protein
LWRINEQTQKIEELERLGNVTGSIKRFVEGTRELISFLAFYGIQARMKRLIKSLT